MGAAISEVNINVYVLGKSSLYIRPIPQMFGTVEKDKSLGTSGLNCKCEKSSAGGELRATWPEHFQWQAGSTQREPFSTPSGAEMSGHISTYPCDDQETLTIMIPTRYFRIRIESFPCHRRESLVI